MNIEIDDKLLADAMAASGARTKQEAVELGLAALSRVHQQGKIRDFRGKLAWQDNLGRMRRDP